VNVIGQRTGVTTSGTALPAVPSWMWTYDALGQFVAADSIVTISDRAYQYDTIGNRKKSANSLTLPLANDYALNQYTSIPSLAFIPSYDFDGNMTSGPLPISPTTNSTLARDAENRLIFSTVGAVTTTYLYDAWNCLADYSRSAGVSPTFTLNKTRLWGTDLSGTPQGAGGVVGLLSESYISNPQSPIYYPLYDGNGNISEYLTTTVAHFEYDPSGNTVVNTDAASLFTYRFSTKPRDIETGLYYYGYRYYDPMTSRWLSRDPIGEKGGVNLYAFVKNKIIIAIDILGIKTFSFEQSEMTASGGRTHGKEKIADIDIDVTEDTSGYTGDTTNCMGEVSFKVKFTWTSTNDDFVGGGNTLGQADSPNTGFDDGKGETTELKCTEGSGGKGSAGTKYTTEVDLGKIPCLGGTKIWKKDIKRRIPQITIEVEAEIKCCGIVGIKKREIKANPQLNE
jgi:RHS repeat-associated protein